MRIHNTALGAEHEFAAAYRVGGESELLKSPSGIDTSMFFGLFRGHRG